MSNVSQVKRAGNAARIGADVSADGYICISEGRALLRRRWWRSDTNAKAVAGGKNNTAFLRRQCEASVLRNQNTFF